MHPILLCLLLFAGFTIAIILIAAQWEKKRTEAMRQAAAAMGLTFQAVGDAEILTYFAGFHLFSQGHARKVRNLMRGETSETELSIFDYRYTTGSGKNSHTWNQTVICIRSDKLHLPDFSLRPENIFHKIGALFGYQDIDFEDHPKFSSHYLLRGSNEKAIRAKFHDALLCYLDEHGGLCIEATGDRLVFYRASQVIKPENLHSFMDEGLHVANLFME